MFEGLKAWAAMHEMERQINHIFKKYDDSIDNHSNHLRKLIKRVDILEKDKCNCCSKEASEIKTEFDKLRNSLERLNDMERKQASGIVTEVLKYLMDRIKV